MCDWGGGEWRADVSVMEGFRVDTGCGDKT
jgi:hypothetical protein